MTVEALVSFGWEAYAGDEGAIIGIDHFGASAPGDEVLARFGFTVDRVAEVARGVLRGDVHGPIPTLEPGHLPAGGAAREPRASHDADAGGTGRG